MRNVYLTDEQSLTRKLREAYLATQMADQWSKNKILATYLNTIPYGPVTYGCEAAAAAFFNTHCKDLTLVQSALIAGLPQSPTEYNPQAPPGRGPGAPKPGARRDAVGGHITTATSSTRRDGQRRSASRSRPGRHGCASRTSSSTSASS